MLNVLRITVIRIFVGTSLYQISEPNLNRTGLWQVWIVKLVLAIQIINGNLPSSNF